jgi:hypothetical protein
MLVNHPDPRRNGFPRRGESAFPPLDADAACIGLVKAVQDIHQGAFPGPVLAQKRMDLSGEDVKIDPAIRPDGGEAFRDAQHLDQRPLSF